MMFKKNYFKGLVAGLLFAQILLLSNTFAAPLMKIGLTSSDNTRADGTTIWQKSYCSGTGYMIMDPNGATNVYLVNMILKYSLTGTTISTGSWSYLGYCGTSCGRNATDTRTPNPVLSVNNTVAGYAALPAGEYLNAGGYDSATSPIYYTTTFSLGSLFFTNKFGVGSTFLSYYADPAFPTATFSSYMGLTNLSGGYSYTMNYQFIPEPCTPDTNPPRFLGTDSVYGPNFMPLNQAQFPNNHLPSPGELWGAKIDSGVMFGIVEPNQTQGATPTSYIYSGGSPMNNVVTGLDTSYTGGYGGTPTNQWGINTGSVKIYLSYTGVARGTINQKGTGIAIIRIFSGSDLIFDYTGSRTWNQNYQGASVSVSGTLIAALLEFKKETVASIGFTGQDWNNSLPSIINLSGANRNPANILFNNAGLPAPSAATNGWIGYSFNGGNDPHPYNPNSNNPTAQLSQTGSATGSTNVLGNFPGSSRLSTSKEQITYGQTGFHFRFTDNWAGINSGTIRVTVQVFTAVNTVDNGYQIDFAGSGLYYLFSGSELHLVAYTGAADTPDFTGYVDITGKISRSLTTGDRVRITLYAEDYVGNIVITPIGFFDMPAYPPKPYPNPLVKNFTLNKGKSIFQTNGSNWYISGDSQYNAYTGLYGMILSGVTYKGQTNIELTGSNLGSNLSGIFLSGGVLYGTAFIDNMTGIRTFTFTDLLIYNIWNQTGAITINITVQPSCGDAPGCGDRIMIYTGTSLSEVTGKIALQTGGTWYNNWFVKINTTERPVWTGTADTALLLCPAGITTNVIISNLNSYSNAPFNSTYIFNSGTTLTVSGDTSYAGMSGVIYRNGNIYVWRPLTGNISYNTGQGAINWTRNIITGTIVITGGYITGDNGLFGSSSLSLGGGVKTYTYASTGGNTGFTVLIENRWNTTGTYEPAFYRTGSLTFNTSWLDLQTPIISAGYNCQGTGTITLISLATGYGENFTGFGGNLTYANTSDDEFIITAITTGTTFITGNSNSGAWIYDIDANSGSWTMTGSITFASNTSGYVWFQDRAGNTGYVFVETICTNSTAYAIPGYRGTGNFNFTGVLSIYTLTGSGPIVGTYFSSQTGFFGPGGTGNFSLPTPLYGQSIGIVLNTTFTLPALGFVGTFTGQNFFDFTIWTGAGSSLYSSGWYDRVDLGNPFGYVSLLVPGDVDKTVNVSTGSIINSLDMTLINLNLTTNATQTHPEYDFDNNGGIISSYEQAVIIQNLQRQGWDLDLDRFEGFNYVP